MSDGLVSPSLSEFSTVYCDPHSQNFLCCWKRMFSMTSMFSWQNSISLWPASCCSKAKCACFFRCFLTSYLHSYDILKSRDIALSTKVHLVKAMVFPVVMYGCESWSINKADHQRIDAFELGCWRRCLRVLWTTGDPTSASYRKSVLNIHWMD